MSRQYEKDTEESQRNGQVSEQESEREMDEDCLQYVWSSGYDSEYEGSVAEDREWNRPLESSEDSAIDGEGDADEEEQENDIR